MIQETDIVNKNLSEVFLSVEQDIVFICEVVVRI